jgi:lysophospholipase L1-like esterase
MTWNVVSDTTFVGPVSAGAAGSTLQNGWIDLSGNQWSIDSSNYADATSNGNPWSGGSLIRPSSENTIDQQIVIRFMFSSSVAIFATLRHNRSTSSTNCYIIGSNGGSTINAYTVVGGGVGGIGQGVSFSPAPSNGTLYDLTVSIVQTNSTTSTVNASLADTSGTVLGTYSFTDTTSGLQNVSTGIAICVLGGGSGSQIQRARTYTDLSVSTANTITLSGPTAAVIGTASTPFTVTPNGNLAANTIVTPAATGGGTFTPTTVTLAIGTSANATFTYTPNSVGTKSISITNNQSLTNAGTPISLTASAATLTFTGPTTGASNVASTAFTVTPSGTIANATVVTPASSAGGIFTPTTVTIPSGSTNAVTFTYTPNSAGTESISITDNQGIAITGSPISYISTANVILGATSTAVKFSPGNWRGDSGRGGSVYRQSWYNGAWVNYTWTASATPNAVLMISSNSTTNMISYFINGNLTDNIAANGNVTISNITANATNNLTVYLRNSYQGSRWASNATNIVQITGLQLDGGSTSGVATTGRPWGMIVGDSITEGIEANNGNDDNLVDYSFLVGRAMDQLGYDTCVFACGGTGMTVQGDYSGDVPAYYYVSGSTNGVGGTYNDSISRWNKIDAITSLLDTNGQISSYGSTGTSPSFILINYGTNDQGSNGNYSDFQASINQCLIALRAAAPNALIAMLIPFNLYNSNYAYGVAHIASIKAAVAAYQSSYPSDTKVIYIDLGPTVSASITYNNGYANGDNIHPLAAGHAYLAPMVTAKLITALSNSVSNSTTIIPKWTH